MCLAMYLFTDSELPTSEWSETSPGVYVEAADSGEDLNARDWPHDQTYIYYLGSSQGCGCGWAPAGEYDDVEETEQKVKDRRKLVDLLKTVDLQRTWLVICWEGAKGNELGYRKRISLHEVMEPTFEFAELQPHCFVDETRAELETEN